MILRLSAVCREHHQFSDPVTSTRQLMGETPIAFCLKAKNIITQTVIRTDMHVAHLAERGLDLDLEFDSDREGERERFFGGCFLFRSISSLANSSSRSTGCLLVSTGGLAVSIGCLVASTGCLEVSIGCLVVSTGSLGVSPISCLVLVTGSLN